METISEHFLGGLPPGEPPGLPPELVATWFQGEGYKAMSNFVILRHFLTISGHFLGGLPPGEPPGLPPGGDTRPWAMSNFVILWHFLGAGPDGDDLGAFLRRSTTW